MSNATSVLISPTNSIGLDKQGNKRTGFELNYPNQDYRGGLAGNFDNTSEAQNVDIVRNYPWTSSEKTNREDIPYIQLTEFRNDESMLKRQAMFYGKGAFDTSTGFLGGALPNSMGGSLMQRGQLAVYDEIWSSDNPTGWSYTFPYFSKTQYEINTPTWEKVDGIGQALSDFAGGAADTATKIGGAIGERLAKGIRGITAGANFAAATAELALKGVSPLVGVVDRPRIFTQHAERSVTIQFPLYNTFDARDWKWNREFYYVFATQNLFNKRDFVTGLPPVWYRVLVPGQYFSHASCVTNFNVENLGNVRTIQDDNGVLCVVPDAYQISITLTEMLMPSVNQFQALINDDARSRVTVRTVSRAEADAALAARRVQVPEIVTRMTNETLGLYRGITR